MSQTESPPVMQIDSTMIRDFDVELGLELDTCFGDLSGDARPQPWNKSPLHVRRIERKDGRPVSAEVNYDTMSRKLLIYTFSGGGDDRSTKTGSDLYLRRQSQPEALRQRWSDGAVGGWITDLSSESGVREERDVVWEKRKSYDGCGDTAAGEGEDGGAVHPSLNWRDARNDGKTVTGERHCSSSSSSLQRKVGNQGETVGTHLDEIQRRGEHLPTQGDRLYGERLFAEGTGDFQRLLNRGDIGEDCSKGDLRTPSRTGSSLPSVVLTNDVQFRSQEDMRRIWPPQIDWRIPKGDKERSPREILAQEIIPGMRKLIMHSEAEQRKQPSLSFPQDVNNRTPFCNQYIKSPTATDGVSHSEEFVGSPEGHRGAGCLRHWLDSSYAGARASLDKGVPLRIEIPHENSTPRHPVKERSQRSEADVLRSATTYLNFRRPEVIREGLALNTNSTGTTGISRNLNVYCKNRFSETTRTRESGNTETLSTGDSDGGGSQINESLIITRRKPLDLHDRYGSMNDGDATGSLQRSAIISAEDKLDSVSSDVTVFRSPQSNLERLEHKMALKQQICAPSETENNTIKLSLMPVNPSETEACSPQRDQNVTHYSIGADRERVEATSGVQSSSKDGLEGNRSAEYKQFQSRRFLSESNIGDCPKVDDVSQGESQGNSRPLRDRSGSVPIISHRPPPGSSWQFVPFSDRHHPQLQSHQSGDPITNSHQQRENTWTKSESSKMLTAGARPTSQNTLASIQPILDLSSASTKDVKSPDSGRSFVQSLEYMSTKNPRMTEVAPKCSVTAGVPAEGRRSEQPGGEKTQRIPLVFYNSKYKQQAELTDPLARGQHGKESETRMQLSGTGELRWNSISGNLKPVEAERTGEHKSVECRQDVPPGRSILTEKKPPTPRLEMSAKLSQSGDWHYNTLYEPDVLSPLSEVPPAIKKSTGQDDHDAVSMIGQPENQWSSLPSHLDRDDSGHGSETSHKSISSDRIHSRVWTPTHRRPILRTSVDENSPETKTTTGESREATGSGETGSSMRVFLREDAAANRCLGGKQKTTYKREIKQIPSVATKMFVNTKRNYETPGKKIQTESGMQAERTEVNDETFENGVDISGTVPEDLGQETNRSDSSVGALAETTREGEWKSAEVLVDRLSSQKDRAPKINERDDSMSDTFEGRELKPKVVHLTVQHEVTANSVHPKEIEGTQAETVPKDMVGSSRPAVTSSPEISGDGIKLGSAERVASDLPNDNKTIRPTFRCRADMKPDEDPSPGNHLPQIDITTINARVYRITQDNGAMEFHGSTNQLDNGEQGLPGKSFVEVGEHPLNMDREALPRHVTTERGEKEISDQIARRLEDLGMDQTFRDIDEELEKLMMMVEESKSTSNSDRSIVQPLSSANLSLLDQSRAPEWRNTSLEYAKQWLMDRTAQGNGSQIDVDNCFNEDFSAVDIEISDAPPQLGIGGEEESCGFDAELIESILRDFAADKSERFISEGIGITEPNSDVNAVDNTRPSKARSRALLTDSALGIPAPTRPTQLQVYPDDKTSCVRPIRDPVSRSQAQETQAKVLEVGQGGLPETPYKQTSASKGGYSFSRGMTLDGNTHQRKGPLSFSAMPRGEVETLKHPVAELGSRSEHGSKSEQRSRSEQGSRLEQRPRSEQGSRLEHGSRSEQRPRSEQGSRLEQWSRSEHGSRSEQASRSGASFSATHQSYSKDRASAKSMADRLFEELSELRKTAICRAPPAATTNEKPRGTDTQNNKHQNRISVGLLQTSAEPLPRRETSGSVVSDPVDKNLFHEMTLEWSPIENSSLVAKTESPEQCHVCSRAARLPDVPYLRYYQLNHRCSRSSLQHVDEITAAHSTFLINSTSELGIQELRNLARLVSGRHCSSVPLHGSSVPLHDTSIPLHGSSVPLHDTSVPLHGSSVPLHGSSVPVQGGSRRSMSAADSFAVGKRRPISSDLTNASDPCLLSETTPIFESASRGHPIQNAACINHHHPLRKDERDLFTQRLKAMTIPSSTDETQATTSGAESRRTDPTLWPQSSEQSATRQSSVNDDTQVVRLRSISDDARFSPHEAGRYGDRKTIESVGNVVTEQSKTSRQSYSKAMAWIREKADWVTSQGHRDIHAVHGTEVRKETKLDSVVPSRYSKTVDDRTIAGQCGDDSTDDLGTGRDLQQDPNRRGLKEIPAVDLSNIPFLKPTVNRKVESPPAALQAQSNFALPSSSLSPGGRVKYRKISQQISDLMPSYDASTFANSNNIRRSNEDKV